LGPNNAAGPFGTNVTLVRLERTNVTLGPIDVGSS